MKICRKFEAIEKINEGYLIALDKAYMKVCFVTDSIVRIKVSFDDLENIKKSEGSYVLQLTAWDDRLDFLFGDEREHVKALEPELSENEKEVVLKTGSSTLTIKKDHLNIRLEDKDGDIV